MRNDFIRTHNPKDAGLNPASAATKNGLSMRFKPFFICMKITGYCQWCEKSFSVANEIKAPFDMIKMRSANCIKIIKRRASLWMT